MNILEMRNIYKGFNGVPVLTGVSLDIQKGEIHALLGENGAGKSTLMNILTGVLGADEGTITFDGKELHNNSVHKSESLGIAFVHQELNLFNDLKVYENLFLGKEYTYKFGALKKKEMAAKAHELFCSLGVDIDATAMVSNLSTSEKQLLEICKSLFIDAKLIILDEPTTALNTDEIERLFNILRALREKGKSFIIISHKMPEIFAIADTYTILRNGKFIKNGPINETTPEEITKAMVGESYSSAEIYSERSLGEPILEFEHFSGPGFKDVTLSVRKGEVIGLTGLQGAGSCEFMECAFGVTPAISGIMSVRGNAVSKNSIQRAMKRGMALLPSNRKENSVIPDMTILENMCISEQVLSAKHSHINKKKEVQKYRQQKENLNIKAANHNNLILSLSGGNQQKVIFSRWLNTKADILLLQNPTQGIDVGAKAEIYRLIMKLAESGKTILINTLEVPEIQKVADRCIVFYEGSIIKSINHNDVNEHEVMMYATNAVCAEEVKNGKQ